MDTAQYEKIKVLFQNSTDHDLLAQAIDQLGMDGSSRAIALLLESFDRMDFALKELAFSLLMKIEHENVYTGLRSLFKTTDTELFEDLLALTKKLEITATLAGKMVLLSAEPENFPSLDAALEILGIIGDETTIDIITGYLYHCSNDIKDTAIECLQKINSPICIKHLFTPLKLATPDQKIKIIDLIGSFMDKSSILPLIYAMSELPELMRDKILSIITRFPPEELGKVLDNHLTQEDQDLCRNALTILEKAARFDTARRVRSRYRAADSIAPINYPQITGLEFQIKKTGDIAIVALAGTMDIYTLPRMSQVLEALFNKGHVKLLLFCEQVYKLDNSALIALSDLAQKVACLGGLIKIISLKITDEYQRETLLKDIEHYPTMKEAIVSFSKEESSRAVTFASEKATPGTLIELQVFAGSKPQTRSTRVISFDGHYLVLEWNSKLHEDTFREGLGTNVKVVIAQQNEVFEFDSRVIDQAFPPDSRISLSRPRMGRVVAHRRHARAETTFPVVFFHVIDNQNIRKDLKGVCRDISLGGLRLHTHERLKINDMAVVLFTGHPQVSKLKVLGKIVRVSKSLSKETTCFEYGISYAHLQPTDREKIAGLVIDIISSRLDGTDKPS